MKKKSVMSKPARLFCVLFMLVMLGSMVGMVASAYDYDYQYSSYGYFGDGAYTQVKPKDTDSSIRLRSGSTCPIYVDIFGCNSTGGNSILSNYSGTTYVQPDQDRTIMNYVYENGRRYAKLFLYTPNNDYQSLYVQWSLDI